MFLLFLVMRARTKRSIKLTARCKFKISSLFYVREINGMHVPREQNEAHRSILDVLFYITTCSCTRLT